MTAQRRRQKNHSAKTDVLIVDGNSIAHRALHAEGGDLSYDGHPTGMMLVFLRMLRAALDDTQARGCWVAWDGGIPPFRKQLLPGYKDKGKLTEEGAERRRIFTEQQDYLAGRLLPALGVRQLRVPNTEADDILGWWASLGRGQYQEDAKWGSTLFTIFSSDRDMWQLIAPRVKVYPPDDRLFGGKFIHLDNFNEITGVGTPEQWLHLRALTGDDSDRIPGVGGVGMVRGREIVQMGGLESAWARHKYGAEWVDARLPAYRRNLKLMDLAASGLALLGSGGAAPNHVYPKADFSSKQFIAACEERALNSIRGKWFSWAEPFRGLKL